MNAPPVIAVAAFALLTGACGATSPNSGKRVEAQPTIPDSRTTPEPQSLTSSAAWAPIRYRLSLPEDPNDPRVDVSLWLGEALEGPITLDVPPAPGRTQRRNAIEHVRCLETNGATEAEQNVTPLVAGENGFHVPQTCRRLQYAVRLAPADPPNPRARLATYRPAPEQWFVPGAAMFLVPGSLRGRGLMDFGVSDELLVTHSLGGAGPMGLRLPPPSSLAQVTVSFGEYETESTFADGTRFIHHMDSAEAQDLEGFEEGIAALHRMTGVTPPALIHGYWLGQSRNAAARLSGSAGTDSVVVTYWNDLPESAPRSKRLSPLAVFYHQYFVALAGPRVPPWLAESLGQFVALLAWQESGAITERGLQAVLSSAPIRAEGSLIASYRSYETTGANDEYRRFYLNGLGYWDAVDKALPNGLESVIEPLLGIVYGADGTPPARFNAVLSEAGARNAQQLADAWLGF